MTYKQTIKLMDTDKKFYRRLLRTKMISLHDRVDRLGHGRQETELPGWLADVIWNPAIRKLVAEYKQVEFWYNQINSNTKQKSKRTKWERRKNIARDISILQICEMRLGLNRGKYKIKNAYLCPLHSENRPSFIIYERTNSWYCFSCQTGGDVIELIMKVEGLGFQETIKSLTD